MQLEDGLRELLAAAMIARVSFKLMHWYAGGESFQEAHDLAEEYAVKMTELEDEFAEALGRFPDAKFVQATDAYQLLDDSEFDYPIIGSDHQVLSFEAVVGHSNKILGSITMSIARCLKADSIENEIGIKSLLEGIYEDLDKEVRYLNRRRLLPTK